MDGPWPMRLGILAAMCWALHAAWHVLHGTAHDLLWACNVASPLLALGCFLRRPVLCATAVMWLAYGVPMWLLDLATGGELIPTSVFTHFGGLVLGILAVRRFGWPKRSWRWAALGTWALVVVTRIATTAKHNVNLAFRVHDGWEKHFTSHALYLVLMLSGSALVFLVVETAALRLMRQRRDGATISAAWGE